MSDAGEWPQRKNTTEVNTVYFIMLSVPRII
jgi:hypothetical protein